MLSTIVWLASSALSRIGLGDSLWTSNHGNSTSIQALVPGYQAVLIAPPSATPSCSRTPTRAKLQARTPKELEGRQTCTNDANNFCFANSGDSCAKCGLCCTAAGGGWCCGSSGVTCCASEKAKGGTGCCWDWQTCTSANGCQNPSVTITSTTTVWVSTYTYSYYYITYGETAQNTFSATTTVTEYVQPKVRKAREAGHDDLNEGVLIPQTPHSGRTATPVQPLVAAMTSSPDPNLLDNALVAMGLLLKRQQTSTSVIWVTTTATTTVTSTITSSTTQTGTQATTVYLTKTATITGINTRTSDTSTTQSTSTSGGSSSGASQDPNANTGNQNSSGMSTGVKAGIAIGAAGVAAIIAAILIVLWRKRKPKEVDAVPAPVAVPMLPPTDEKYPTPQSPQPYYPPHSPHSPQPYQQQQSPQWSHGEMSSTSPGPYPTTLPHEAHGDSAFQHVTPYQDTPRYEMPATYASSPPPQGYGH